MREKDKELRRRRNRRRKRLARRLRDDLATIKKAARSTGRKRGDKTATAGEPAAAGRPAEGRASEGATRKTVTKRAPKKPTAPASGSSTGDASRAAAPADKAVAEPPARSDPPAEHVGHADEPSAEEGTVRGE